MDVFEINGTLMADEIRYKENIRCTVFNIIIFVFISGMFYKFEHYYYRFWSKYYNSFNMFWRYIGIIDNLFLNFRPDVLTFTPIPFKML